MDSRRSIYETRLDVNLIAAAPGVVEDLDRLIHEFQRQADVTRSLLNAERELRSKLSHNIKFNRIRPTLKFIYGPRPANQLQRRRRESMSMLDHSSKAMCALAFTPYAIQQLSDDAFEALMRGISTFVQKKKLAELIESEVGYFIRRTLKGFLNESPTPLLWVHDRASQRRTVHAKERRNFKGPFAAPGYAKECGTETPAQSTAGGNVIKVPQLNNPQGSAAGMSSGHSRIPGGLSSGESLERLPSDAAGTVNLDHALRHSDADSEQLTEGEIISDIDIDFLDVLYNDPKASWFGRGVGLSDAEVLEQLEQWIHIKNDQAWMGDAS